MAENLNLVFAKKWFTLKTVGKIQLFSDTETAFSDNFSRFPSAASEGAETSFLFFYSRNAESCVGLTLEPGFVFPEVSGACSHGRRPVGNSAP